MAIHIHYYDGQKNIAHQAVLLQHTSGAVVRFDDTEKLYHFEQMTYIGPVGNILPAIELPDDARIEFLDKDVPSWLNIHHKALSDKVHVLERSWRWIALSFVVMVVVVITTFKWGIPFAAEQIAMQLPQKTLNSVGKSAEQFVIEHTEKTTLSKARQQQITALYNTNIQTKNPAKIMFREGGSFFSANALAIPNGTIILTDELVKLAKNDHELLAVLAHEQGHLDDQHSLQQALQGIGIAILYVSITGDASDIMGGLPLAVINANYSQKFELQADQHAISELKRLNISPQYLADFLKRLSQDAGEETDSSDFLQSHPATDKRIAQIQAQL